MGGPQWIEPDLRVIYVHCFGRPSTFYRGMGEEDVLEVIDEVKRRFPVDADRVYIMGHSMGGSGSYTVGLHYPDRFGGIMPIDAAMGSGWDGGRGRIRPRRRPGWSRRSRSMTPPGSYPNVRNVDVFFKNAGAGIQGRSTEFTDGIVDEGGFSTAESFPGMPHNFGDAYPYSHFVTELIQHPIRRKPSEVKFYTNTLRYNRAYWVTIDRLTRHNSDAGGWSPTATTRAVSTSPRPTSTHSRSASTTAPRRRAGRSSSTATPSFPPIPAAWCSFPEWTDRGRRARGRAPS